MEQAAEYELSIIVPCTKPKKAQLLLNGFTKQKGNHGFEVILVGNVPDNETNYPFHVAFIKTNDIHVNAKRNKGLEQSSGLFIALLDDDTVPSENWVEQALLSVNQHPNSLIAGRETPCQNSQDAKLAFAVSQLFITEGYKGHVNTKTESLNWWEVPFCNCVGNRQIFQTGFDISIPWDMDDFHFCFAKKDEVTFYNNPSLIVKHDRYPNKLAHFLTYKWNLRVRTGEKIISHPQIYLKIPSMIILLLSPFILGVIIISGLLPICLAAYALILLFSVVRFATDQFVERIWLIFRMHAIIFFGYWYGALKRIIC